MKKFIRLYGYDKMPNEPVIAEVQAGSLNPFEVIAIRISQFFTARGYHETISYSFVDPELQQELYPDIETMQLLNPISSELSQMRVGMWPGLLASMIYNIHRQQTVIKFFENGVIFDLSKGSLKEHQCVAGLVTGEHGTLNWSETSRKFDFFDLKGDLEALFKDLKLEDAQFIAATALSPSPRKICRYPY